jgi:hypothetical protein
MYKPYCLFTITTSIKIVGDSLGLINNLATFLYKAMGTSFSDYEFSSYKLFFAKNYLHKLRYTCTALEHAKKLFFGLVHLLVLFS